MYMYEAYGGVGKVCVDCIHVREHCCLFCFCSYLCPDTKTKNIQGLCRYSSWHTGVLYVYVPSISLLETTLEET